MIDLALIVLGHSPDRRLAKMDPLGKGVHLSLAPVLEYTLATQLSGGASAVVAYQTGPLETTNTSSFVGEIKYTQRQQFLLPVQSSIWMPGNKYVFLGDWRYLDFPQDTYGIGGHTTVADGYTVTYKYVRFYEYALKNIGNNLYAGLGYQLDYHWGIAQLLVPQGVTTDYTLYGFNNHSISSGMAVTIQYDSRKSSINPDGGSFFANLQFLQNAQFLGSDAYYNSLLIDVRKYFAAGGHNVLGLWFYSVLGLSGKAPYLDLPGSGTDTYNNSGRGYEQSRFIGKRYIDLEAEYRFGITRNGLLGGVIFCNAASVSDFNTNRFEVIYPGFGFGLRIKINKFSNTNGCFDYGIGTKGSKGLFGNLGEVF